MQPAHAVDELLHHVGSRLRRDQRRGDVGGDASVAADDEDGYVDTVPDAVSTTTADDVPAAIEDDLAALGGARPAAGVGRWAWRVAATLFGVVLLLELALVLREPLVAAWPQSGPLIARLCELPLCPAASPDAGAVELLAREVRDHPQYENTLLVNATVVNRTDAPHPYPTIELILRDGNGQLLGARRFAPDEYLDGSIDAAAGMPPAQPVYLVLELGGDAARANSFEFNFL